MKDMLLLNMPKEESGHAVIYNLIKHYDLEINIIRASIDYNAVGFMIVEVNGEDNQIQLGIKHLQDSNIEVQLIDSAILINKETCIDCGACSAVCAVDALYLDEMASLVFDSDKCLDCKMCIAACPERAIESVL